MKIIACCKVVPEEQDISINADRTVNIEKAAPKISQYDLNALEAALQLGEGNTITVLSMGDKRALENSKIRKDILSRGADALVVIVDDAFTMALPEQTASVLAQAVQKTGFDLVLCGEGSGDLYAQQVGLLLGEKLNVASINAVSKIRLCGDSVEVERTLENEMETLRIPLPAVLSVTTGINVPRIPAMKAILAAGKKPVNVMGATEVSALAPAPSVIKSIMAPEQSDRLHSIIEGDSDDNIAAFVENIRKILK